MTKLGQFQRPQWTSLETKDILFNFKMTWFQVELHIFISSISMHKSHTHTYRLVAFKYIRC